MRCTGRRLLLLFLGLAEVAAQNVRNKCQLLNWDTAKKNGQVEGASVGGISLNSFHSFVYLMNLLSWVLGSGLIELGVRSKQLINNFLNALTGGNPKKKECTI